MKTITEIKQEYAALLLETEGILDACDTDERSMSPEETAKYDAAIARLTEMKKDIEQRMKLEAVQTPVFNGQKPAIKPQPNGEPDDTPIDQPQATIRNNDAGPRIETVRAYGNLKGFSKTPKGHMDAYRAGMWLHATVYGNASSQDWCRRNGVGVRSALSGGINTAGGVLVPTELEQAIIDLREEYGLLRRVARVHPMSSDTTTTPRRVGGLTAYYTGENTAITESDPSWDDVNLVAKKLATLTRMSSEVSEDAIIDLSADLAQEIAYAFATKEDTVGLTGTGIASDGGITGILVKAIDASHTKAKVAAASGHDLMSEIDADDLLNVMAAVPQYAKAGSAWFCSPSVQSLVFDAIKIAGGGNTSDILTQANRPSFLGYPIYVTPVMADTPATNYNGAVILAFGNLRQAMTIGDRRGIRIALSDSRYFDSDQIAIKGTMRHDINVHDLGSTTVKSPFAVLVGLT